jgi:hypothetical protein
LRRITAIHVLGAPVQSFWRIDVAPLSTIELRRNGRQDGPGFSGLQPLGLAAVKISPESMLYRLH